MRVSTEIESKDRFFRNRTYVLRNIGRPEFQANCRLWESKGLSLMAPRAKKLLALPHDYSERLLKRTQDRFETSKCLYCQSRITGSMVKCPGCWLVIPWRDASSGPTVFSIQPQVKLKRERQYDEYGNRRRVRCPCCDKPISLRWSQCRDCGLELPWEK